MCGEQASSTAARDTQDGFVHVWVADPILSVDSKAVHNETCTSARMSSVRAAAYVNRVCSLRAARSAGDTQGLIIWHCASRLNTTTASTLSSRNTREPHAGEPALVFVRGDGVAVIEIYTHLVTFEDWVGHHSRQDLECHRKNQTPHPPNTVFAHGHGRLGTRALDQRAPSRVPGRRDCA